MLDYSLSIPYPGLSYRPKRFYVAILISLLLHAVILWGITFKVPEPVVNNVAKSLEIILVNSKSEQKPIDTNILAQTNLEGGGNVNEDQRAKSPLPVLPQTKPLVDLAQATKKTKQLENEVKKLMSAVESKPRIIEAEPQTEQSENKPTPSLDRTDLLQRSLEIARLEAQISKEYEEYQKRPKRKFIGARTKEYRFARYVEDWRLKVERIGNLNYPEEARKQQLYGNLQLTVGIRSDGSLESISIDRSSGTKILDDAAIRIVRLAAQNGFAPFPPDISRDTDILHITRTWVFERSDKLISE
ncbi:energy transducer TonB [Nitrosomonas sp. Nm33]|uniref:energy transducer TonB n=1 Tax=Nitrosomonas sp. Nm33 TaxID=133724 RepID=UPI00089D6877|nr:energy transducer TonB [Nitrosomonas sp. Nm33]SDY48016.1 protein TonB [Nitrosomonas sp. Nm33]